ncbi:hypothetical protein D9M71_568850 [compost metagenome]
MELTGYSRPGIVFRSAFGDQYSSRQESFTDAKPHVLSVHFCLHAWRKACGFGAELPFNATDHDDLRGIELFEHVGRMRGKNRLCRLAAHPVDDSFLYMRRNRDFWFLHRKDDVLLEFGDQ